METLEFIIRPDGRVEEKVTGIVGSSCSEVTALIEAKLGRVLSQKPTSEYYAQSTMLEQGTIAQNHDTHDW